MNRLLLIFTLFFCGQLSAQVAAIDLAGNKLPASDLIYKNRVLTPEEALALNTDLSNLEPSASDIWSNAPKSIQESDFSINSGDSTRFQSIIKTQEASGEFICKVLASDNTIQTLLFDKKLHSTFLRNNILKKLGYIIPGMKYLKEIVINFDSKIEKELFLKKMTYAVLGKPDHWIKENEKNSLSLTLHDVGVIGLGDGQLYDLAAGVPVIAPYNALRTRVIRSTVLAYSLVNLDESVNKFSWDLGRIDQKRLLLPHFFSAHTFNPTTIDDIKWMAKKIAKLKKNDFKEIVEQAHFPSPVDKIVLEKIISRRNSILNLLNISNQEMSFDSNITDLPNLKNGKLVKKDWKDMGYASKFATGDATSPFKDFHYYILSILQSTVIDNFIAKINTQFETFDPTNARLNLAEKEFKQGLDHFVRTGEFLQFPVSAWSSPILNGTLIASRDVIVGNYLGTENLVQLADTFGYGINTGLFVGLENQDIFNQTILNGTLSYVKSFTHLKPLISVKDVFKENYKNIFVPLLKKNLSRSLNRAANKSKEFEPGDKPDEEEKFLREIMAEISKVLGDGESLIITERLSPSISASTLYPLIGTGFTFRLAFGANQIGIKRMQILRKDSKTIQILDDRGNAIGYNFSVDLSNKIPIVRFNHETKKGQYKVKSFLLNVEANPKKNPSFYENLQHLNQVLTTGSTKFLSEVQTPSIVEGDFVDKYNRTAFLFLRRRRLKGFTKYQISALGSLKGEYVSYRDTINQGNNWESFIKDTVQYYLSQASGDLEWANDIWKNPGQSLLGVSKTDESSYEARVNNDGKLDLEYISLGYRYQGWSKNKNQIIKIAKEINEKFEQTLFDENQFYDLKKLSLYEILATVSIYQDGVNRLKSLTRDDLIKNAYFKELEKLGQCTHPYVRTMEDGKNIPTCGYLSTAINTLNRCERLEKNDKSLRVKVKCWKDFASSLFNHMPFTHFAQLIGTPNIFVEGSINGFRKDSELLREPILSNTFGRKYPNYPNGPIQVLERKLGIGAGEFEGYWMRDRL